MGLFKKIFAPVVQYYEKIKAEEEERKRREDLRKQRIAYIKANGKYISAVRNLNNSIGFKNIESHPRFKRICNSKAQLDNFNIDNHMLLTIEDSSDYFTGIVKAVQYNRKKHNQYEEQYKKILYNGYNSKYYSQYAVSTVIEANELQTIEMQECQKIKKKPTEDFTIELIVCYTSPQGRNEYTRTYKFDCAKIEYYLNEYQKLQKNKESAVYQRQLMTPKLRYEIMKRDKFKCTICGRSQKDGAKLHVDHIKPVSKGGKTIESNLRTLCDICNLGKSNSYDPYGLN